MTYHQTHAIQKTVPRENSHDMPLPTLTYTVQPGDTFQGIAAFLNISTQELQAANPNVNPQILNPGYTVNSVYYVQPGETWSSIASKLGVDQTALEAAGNITGSNTTITNLAPGDWILMPSLNGNGGPGPGIVLPNKGGSYVVYVGSSNGFPDSSGWASLNTLWQINAPLMTYHDTDLLIFYISSAMATVSAESGVDSRAILAVIMQESGGNVNVQSTNNGIVNPGIMQSHNGTAFDPQNPQASILQMVRDGTEGTASGPGLRQLLAQYGWDYYKAFRAYNSGTVNVNDLNADEGATGSYVCDVANRLMGHTWPGM